MAFNSHVERTCMTIYFTKRGVYFYWTVCIKPGKWAVMCLMMWVSILSVSLRFLVFILELFWRCSILKYKNNFWTRGGNIKKNLKIPKGSESVNQRARNTIVNRKRTNNDLWRCRGNILWWPFGQLSLLEQLATPISLLLYTC